MKSRKIFICFLLSVLLFNITFKPIVNQSAQIAIPTVIVLAGACYLGCDYLANPDKYSELGTTMKDFANDTVENQKKLYEIEKANFEYVMKKAVESDIGTCFYGSDGTLYSVNQLQNQEYPSFDTWKGYKEKESQKPHSALWDKFKMAAGMADFLCDIFPNNSGSSGGSADAGEEQLYYTGDDGYIDRETGELCISFTAKSLFYDWTGNSNTSGFRTNIYRFTCSDTIGKNERVCIFLTSRSLNKLFYLDDEDGVRKSCDYRHLCYFGYLFHGTLSGYIFKNININTHVWSRSKLDYIDTSTVATSYSGGSYSCKSDDGTPQYRLWDLLSTNIPVFENSTFAKSYMESGSLEGLINGVPQEGPTPTPQLTSAPHIGPVRQYTNYFSGNFLPSLTADYVNYNIYNNWDGDSNTFNITNYIDDTSNDSDITPTPTLKLLPTLTPCDDGNGGDTNITNNILINQTNIIQNIDNTVTNIYNFFQIDVEKITDEFDTDTPTMLDPLTQAMADIKGAFPADLFSDTGELFTDYPRFTMAVPKCLDRFLSPGDDKVIVEDGVKKIVLCDFADYAIYFSRFRKFLDIIIKIGMFFYLLKELSVMWSIS